MAKAVLAFFVVSALFLCFLPGEAVGDQREFDFWTFSVRWAPTTCRQTTKCCSSNACCRASALNNFVIQALWPDYEDGSYPTFCNCTDGFDLQQISSLIPTLERDFPFLSCQYFGLCNDKTTRLEWAALWDKHGACGYPVIRDQYNYFLKLIQLDQAHDLTRVLADAGFLASNAVEYLSSQLVQAIQVAVGASPTVLCNDASLYSVRLCFTKDFKPRDCPFTSTCPKNLKLPTYGPLGKAADNCIAQVI